MVTEIAMFYRSLSWITIVWSIFHYTTIFVLSTRVYYSTTTFPLYQHNPIINPL